MLTLITNAVAMNVKLDIPKLKDIIARAKHLGLFTFAEDVEGLLKSHGLL